MNCATFRVHFKRLCLVAGLQSPPRPYFLRIGAGVNFEEYGMPTSLMCQILSHTEAVHNQKYQARRLRHDMQSAAFGKLAGDNVQLFKHLGHAGKDYDPKAPIYMNVTQYREAESRRDTTGLKREYEELQRQGSKEEASKARQKLYLHRRRLEELAILARREAYFRDKASRLERGMPQVPSPPPPDPATEDWTYSGVRAGMRLAHAHLRVDDLMRAWAPGTVFDADAETRALNAITWLGYYLSQSASAIARPPALTGPPQPGAG
ncbi:unnamed protein product [Discula destructiva]